MQFITQSVSGSTAFVALNRGKVHAINRALLDELTETVTKIDLNGNIDAMVLTGTGKFFSFGLDVPEIYNYSKEEGTEFLTDFCELYRKLYLLSKPTIAAINGHAIAGGYILALACDRRLMIPEKAKISLNEITFGSTLFAGVAEMLRQLTGSSVAERVILQGEMYNSTVAKELCLIDEIVEPEALLQQAQLRAEELAGNFPKAYGMSKRLFREPTVDRWSRYEANSIKRFVEIWYSPEVRESLKKIVIE